MLHVILFDLIDTDFRKALMSRTQEEKKTLTIYAELAELIKIGIEQCRTSQQKSN